MLAEETFGTAAIWSAQRRQTGARSLPHVAPPDGHHASCLLPPRITSWLAPSQTANATKTREKTPGVDAVRADKRTRDGTRHPRGAHLVSTLSFFVDGLKTRSCPSCLQHKAWTRRWLTLSSTLSKVLRFPARLKVRLCVWFVSKRLPRFHTSAGFLPRRRFCFVFSCRSFVLPAAAAAPALCQS